MMYSIAILISCLEFLNFINNAPIKYKKFINIGRYIYTTPSVIFNNLEKASLIYLKDEYIYISEKGKSYIIYTDIFISSDDFEVRNLIRSLLKEFLISQKFSWLKHLHKGRYECLKKIEDIEIRRSMVSLLKELNLLNETTENVLEWWNEIEKQFDSADEYNIEIGRVGEKCSVKYETMRVGKIPHWESLFSNLSGYDLLSIITMENKAPLKIEVKASNKGYIFYLTSNEWREAENGEYYIFHFWYLPKDELLMFTPNQIKHHIPINTNTTEWTECKVTLSDEEVNFFHIVYNFNKY